VIKNTTGYLLLFFYNDFVPQRLSQCKERYIRQTRRQKQVLSLSQERLRILEYDK
jgi:hypothetical protein